MTHLEQEHTPALFALDSTQCWGQLASTLVFCSLVEVNLSKERETSHIVSLVTDDRKPK